MNITLNNQSVTIEAESDGEAWQLAGADEKKGHSVTFDLFDQANRVTTANPIKHRTTGCIDCLESLRAP